jgi:putative N-acetylmannosamine-6-phosphate epimerase
MAFRVLGTLAVGGWRFAVRSWRFAVGGWQLAVGSPGGPGAANFLSHQSRGLHNLGMTVETLLNRLRQCPLIASVQASEKSPVDHPETLARLARASVQQGVRVLRLEGVKSVRVIKPEAKLPVIGLLKRRYPGSEVYITPTIQDAESMADLGCEIVAFDATSRERPHGQKVGEVIERLKSRKVLAMADCDSLESAVQAERLGADIVGTTLGGYTSAHGLTVGPDLELLRSIVAAVKIPVLAEGRFTQRWEVEAALRIGAVGVVVGGALNDPVKQTKALLPSARPGGKVGAVDLGGTWMRFAVFGQDWTLETIEREALAPTIRSRGSGSARQGSSTRATARFGRRRSI